MDTKVLLTVVGVALVIWAGPVAAQTVDLPTSKQLIGEIPGHPQRINGLPMSMAVSPDGRYVSINDRVRRVSGDSISGADTTAARGRRTGTARTHEPTSAASPRKYARQCVAAAYSGQASSS